MAATSPPDVPSRLAGPTRIAPAPTTTRAMPPAARAAPPTRSVAGRLPPALPGIVVDLPPEDHHADADGDQRHGQARVQAEPERGQEEQSADCQRPEGEQHREIPLAVARLRGLVGVLRREQPEQSVRDDAGTAGSREDDEREPDVQHVHTQVVGETAGDTGEQDPPVAAAVEPRDRSGGRRGRCRSPPDPPTRGRASASGSPPQRALRVGSGWLQGRHLMATVPSGGHDGDMNDTTTSTGTRAAGNPCRSPTHPISTLRRSRHDRKLFGVAGGLGRYAGVDPLIFRILFVVLTFFGGSGILLYALGWLLLPEDGENESEGQRLLRGTAGLDREDGDRRSRRADPRAGLHGRCARHRSGPRRAGCADRRGPDRRPARPATGSAPVPSRWARRRRTGRSRHPTPAPTARPRAPRTRGRLPARPAAAPGRRRRRRRCRCRRSRRHRPVSDRCSAGSP